ncbi:ATP-binding cassette sub-family F member 3-like protein [Dinothrombium tinctorium]|uniref:ATP-binding cassette sub-family F member 3-like protein n=1 Tax=Dinothrombium tinctorium TaxID=1965070 RepID=A0A3S3NLG9_9ACAR|nr:ATP-binding cassette sub-family F member 3-like protein [Dinothrombium tinctorium]
MSNCALSEVICEHFPAVDDYISQYITSILNENSDEIETHEDVFNCLQDVFEEFVKTECKTHDEIINICRKLLSCLKGTEANDFVKEGQKKLEAPITLGDMAKDMSSNIDQIASIWNPSKDLVTQVDQKKLEKAEAKIRSKQEKRVALESQSEEGNVYETQEASVSQMLSRRDVKMDETGKSKDIKLENFDIAFGSKLLLKNANVTLTYGQRYGLIGRNGIGKSTLLKALSNGSLRIPSHIRILHVEQEVVGDETSALQAVLQCDTQRQSLLDEEKELLKAKDNEASARLQEVYRQLTAIEADRAPARAAEILNGLGFTSEMQSRPTKEFSGGWRMRIALARALFSKPDLLLLDEPTNMLDIKAIIWLETYLIQSWTSTLLVVSHDRSFLNSVPTNILHFHNYQIDSYRGNYDNFVKTMTEKHKNQQREYEAQVEFRKHVQEFIDKFRYNAKRASLVQSKIKMLEKLPELKPIEKESKVAFKFPDSEPLAGAPILQLDEVSFAYTKNEFILENISLNANQSSRICIVGDNGSGKTTLLKLLTGDLSPTKGTYHVHRNLKIGYFTQHHVDQLVMNQSSLEFLAKKFPGKSVEHYRTYLGRFGVSGDLSLQPLSSLSGGQKSRVALASMSMLNPGMLILDEPTNHLDVETVDALAQALNTYKGGVILVSHDQQLIKMVCKELWLVKNKNVITLSGGFEEYKKAVESELQSFAK